MDKQKLRNITYRINGETYRGYFHCFGQEGDLQDGIGMYATIEKENGEVIQVDAYQIKFEDR